jgi:DNA-binding phage protein
MKDRDHNEAMAGMFQAEPQFAADYLRQVLADGEPADVRAGLRQMADCAACQPGRPADRFRAFGGSL